MQYVQTRRVDEDIEIATDESRFRQLAVILLDNAVKYCDKCGEINVTLKRLKRGKNNVRLIISNTYAEGNAADCKRFFDRFYRADASHNVDTGGYGIGLSIAQNLCEHLGGSICAQWQGGVISFVAPMAVRSDDSAAAIPPKAQHVPHGSRFFTGVTSPRSRRS